MWGWDHEPGHDEPRDRRLRRIVTVLVVAHTAVIVIALVVRVLR